MTRCPLGFDCALLNSCPSYTLPCPDGFFCASYANHTQLDDLDYGYALLRTLWDDQMATESNKEDYVVPDRVVQSMCFQGFYCPNASTILPCPSDHWCTERTVVPHDCDDLSVCDGEQTTFQVNFINTLIMGIILVIALSTSCFLRHRQLKKDRSARTGDSSIKVSSTSAAKNSVGHDIEGDNAHSYQLSAPEEKENDEVHGLLEVTFRGLSLPPVLPTISGTFPAGKISAILGPTACGKSTLLNVLKRGGEGVASGTVAFTVRDEAKRITWQLEKSAFNSYVGYVPQEDIFDRQLTVRELLTFNALFRGRTIRSEEEARIEVDHVLSQLGIAHVAESIIGGGENQAANISGGQLKRVNIGCELVALSRPGVLLLDEPTAGLDAAVAYDLIVTLEEICKTGITICLILQQPRKEIFTRIDNLFLMSLLGGIVYEGASSGAVPYLNSLGFTIGPDTSDADFCLDVLNNVVPYQPQADAAERHPASRLHLYWDALSNEERSTYRNFHSSNGDEEIVDVAAASSSMKMEILTYNPSLADSFLHFTNQFYLNLYRLFLVRIRNISAIFIYLAINLVMACALSSGFSILISGSYLGTVTPNLPTMLQPYLPGPLSKYRSDNMSSLGLEQLLFFMSSALGVSSCLASVPVFAGFHSVARREYEAGMSLAALTLGRITADCFFVLLNGFIFVGIWCLFGHPGVYYNWMAVVLSTAFGSSGIGYITSAAVSKNSASVLAIIVTIAFCVFAGVQPELKQVNRYPVVDWPWYISFATWTAEATYYTWTRYITDKGHVDIDLQQGADRYGFVIDEGLGRSVGALMAIGVGFRCIAALLFYWKASARKVL
eukprot:gene6863-7586_t